MIYVTVTQMRACAMLALGGALLGGGCAAPPSSPQSERTQPEGLPGCQINSAPLDQAIQAFPSIDVNTFRPDLAVRSVNALVAAGREAACAALEQATRAPCDVATKLEVNEKICMLCRLLFVPRTSRQPLRAPFLGAPELLPLRSMQSNDWPWLPFAIINEVPLSMTLGYTLKGKAESGGSYLAYCKTNGIFRARLLPAPTLTTASNALGRLFVSRPWKALRWTDSGLGWSYALEESYAREMLWKQVEAMTEPAPSMNALPRFPALTNAHIRSRQWQTNWTRSN